MKLSIKFRTEVVSIDSFKPVYHLERKDNHFLPISTGTQQLPETNLSLFAYKINVSGAFALD